MVKNSNIYHINSNKLITVVITSTIFTYAT